MTVLREATFGDIHSRQQFEAGNDLWHRRHRDHQDVVQQSIDPDSAPQTIFRRVKVDVGRFDRNKDVTAVYGNVVKKGIPSVVLLRADGSVAYQTDGGELADARKMGREGVTNFFTAMLEKAK